MYRLELAPVHIEEVEQRQPEPVPNQKQLQDPERMRYTYTAQEKKCEIRAKIKMYDYFTFKGNKDLIKNRSKHVDTRIER